MSGVCEKIIMLALANFLFVYNLGGHKIVKNHQILTKSQNDQVPKNQKN